MTGHRPIVLDTQHEHTPVGVRKGGHVLGDLLTHLATASRLLPAGRTLEHRLAVEVLSLLLSEERGDVEAWIGHSWRAWMDFTGTGLTARAGKLRRAVRGDNGLTIRVCHHSCSSGTVSHLA